MLSLILGFVTGLAGPIASVASKIISLKQKQVEAKTDLEKAKIQSELEQVHDRKAVLIAEAGDRIALLTNMTIRSIMALAAAAVIVKLLAYDKVLGAFVGCNGIGAGERIGCETFSTDPLDTNQWAIIGTVAGFYFLTSAFGRK